MSLVHRVNTLGTGCRLHTRVCVCVWWGKGGLYRHVYVNVLCRDACCL